MLTKWMACLTMIEADYANYDTELECIEYTNVCIKNTTQQQQVVSGKNSTIKIV